MGHESSDPGISQKIPFDAANKEVIRRCGPLIIGLHCQNSDVILADFSGNSCPSQNRHRRTRCAESDTTAEKRKQVALRTGASERKDAGVLQKEITLLGKKQIE